MKELNFKTGLKDGIPIALGYLSVSFTFGITAVNMGIPPITAILISLTNVTSAGQVAGIGIIAAHGGFAEMALAQLIINMRYALMSLSLSQKLDAKYSLFHRIVTSFCVTDEVFAVASGKGGELPARYMYGLITLPYLFWSGGTAVGALLGAILAIRTALRTGRAQSCGKSAAFFRKIFTFCRRAATGGGLPAPRDLADPIPRCTLSAITRKRTS